MLIKGASDVLFPSVSHILAPVPIELWRSTCHCSLQYRDDVCLHTNDTPFPAEAATSPPTTSTQPPSPSLADHCHNPNFKPTPQNRENDTIPCQKVEPPCSLHSRLSQAWNPTSQERYDNISDVTLSDKSKEMLLPYYALLILSPGRTIPSAPFSTSLSSWSFVYNYMYTFYYFVLFLSIGNRFSLIYYFFIIIILC